MASSPRQSTALGSACSSPLRAEDDVVRTPTRVVPPEQCGPK
eukprot:CAMPEP_0119087680 /NCGR_PEP_ID=MMETSP1178-20130426/142634_1 /TAXON_ID=33656 /ORGANISM="unid sp, Strain CCMP2000" /LENGTH=41 /DNA_ID= /DNA_START= /DNA_END= /DNA_ORIENTATION=